MLAEAAGAVLAAPLAAPLGGAVIRVTATGDDDVTVAGALDALDPGAAMPAPALRQPVVSMVRPAANAAAGRAIRMSEFMRFPASAKTEHLMDALEVPRVAVPSGVFRPSRFHPSRMPLNPSEGDRGEVVHHLEERCGLAHRQAGVTVATCLPVRTSPMIALAGRLATM